MSKYKAASDIQLVEMLQDSNHAAYNEIYQRYSFLIIAHAIRKLRDEDVAQDVVQDIFTNLWINRSTIVIKSNLVSYLFIAVRNKAFNFWAHEDIKSKYWEKYSKDLAPLIGSNADTDYKIRERQLQYYIDWEIEQLSPKMRMIFKMSRKEQLSHQEIADQLDTSKENVSKQISNALKILRTKLGVAAYLYLITKYK